jgi:phosphomannomutase
MQIPDHIFRAYDIRGLLQEVTPELAKQVAKALVSITGAKTVVLGRDMRKTSPELARVAAEAMQEMGVDVIDVGMCTTPLFYFSVRHLNAGAGLMITASHNPPEYNGIKFADGKCLPMSGFVFRDLMEEKFSNAEQMGSLRQEDVLKAYIDKCLAWEGIESVKGTRIVADFGNGMGAMTLRPLAARLGITIDEMYPEPDAHFPNHEANPVKPETLVEIKKKIVKEGYDFGIALDGDADRVGFIDNEGEFLAGDLLTTIFADEALTRNPGATFITAPNQSWTVAEELEAKGGRLVESPVGRTLMIQKMVALSAEVSGEVSSHFFFPEFGNLESPEHALVRALTLWKASGKTFADFVRHLRKYKNTGEINFEVPDKAKIMKELGVVYEKDATKVNMLDGVRCEFAKDWWFIARPSNNEPLIRLTIEAKTDELLEEKKEELSQFFVERGGRNILCH